jgi:hypothetical protein
LSEPSTLTAAEMTLWSVLLPALRRAVPVARLARLVWVEPKMQRSPERERGIVEWAERLTKLRPRRTANCLERSLLAYRFLSGAGAAPQLVLGIGRADEGVIGHAWITVDDVPIFETTAMLNDFAPIAVFGSRGIQLGAPHEEIALPRQWR